MGQKKVYVCLVGLSPAVVTTSLWALAKSEGAGSFYPDEVHLITSAKGWTELKNSGFGQGAANDPIRMLWNCLELGEDSPVRRVQPQFHVPEQDDDVVDDDSVDRMGDLIYDVLKDCMRENTQVVLCISGGRKTMGPLASSAFSLLARAVDRMVHVVPHPPELEYSAEFIFPGALDQYYCASDSNHYVSDADASVSLSKVPFFRLPSKLKGSLNVGDVSDMSSIFDRISDGADKVPVELVYYKKTGVMTLGGRDILDYEYKGNKIINTSHQAIAFLRLLGGYSCDNRKDKIAFGLDFDDAQQADFRKLYEEVRSVRREKGQSIASFKGVDAPFFSKISKLFDEYCGDWSSPLFLGDCWVKMKGVRSGSRDSNGCSVSKIGAVYRLGPYVKYSEVD
jgi:CRISPR-associated protein (TIGR02584 family)